MFRRELSLFHAFTSSWPDFTAIVVALGDCLMSNPALPGHVGFLGALAVGAALFWADQPVQSGYWLGACAWGMLALTDFFFEDKLTPSATIEIGSVAVVELEEDDVDKDKKPNTGPHASNANLALKVPACLKRVLGRDKIAFETPFKIMATMLCIIMWWQAPYVSYCWAMWAGVWMVLGSASKCCLEWLPNNGD